MSNEFTPQEQTPQTESAILASEFLALKESQQEEGVEVFTHLERDLFNAGFTLAAEAEVAQTLNDPSLLCRSESFSRVIDLLIDSAPLTITNRGDANMCVMAGGSGFRIAMQEGFSGNDVGNLVKTVISFSGEHLTTRSRIDRSDSLWTTKPKTASVSLSGGGEVPREDVRMVSFRFPAHYFPEDMLSEEEGAALKEGTRQFIVRHYILMK